MRRCRLQIGIRQQTYPTDRPGPRSSARRASSSLDGRKGRQRRFGVQGFGSSRTKVLASFELVRRSQREASYKMGIRHPEVAATGEGRVSSVGLKAEKGQEHVIGRSPGT
jgi:hypothetical protein